MCTFYIVLFCHSKLQSVEIESWILDSAPVWREYLGYWIDLRLVLIFVFYSCISIPWVVVSMGIENSVFLIS